MKKPEKNIPTFYPENPAQWRNWLEKNHEKEDAVWVIFYKKNASQPTLTWSEAVDVALCFGWIDSIKQKLDGERSIQFFSKRKPGSTWSKINKDKIERLAAEGLITKAGWACVDIAKQNGSWELLDAVELLTVPADLQAALEAKQDALAYFESLSKSTKKMLLQWLVLAKRQETRQKRIEEIATLASKKQKPKFAGG
jgi:uncharacterized protein YdeI (YjbR/CyaY-like superfamily)